MSTPNVSSNAPAPVLVPDANTFIGPLFVGNILNWLLMGTLIVQVYVYFINAKGDRFMIRALVYTVFILDVAQTIFATHFAWYYAITNWNNFPALLGNATWSEPTLPIMCGLVSMIVQWFYAWRIWVLKNSPVMRGLSIIIVLVAFTQGTSAIVGSCIFESDRNQLNLIRLHPAFSLWLAGSFVADILISGSMIWILYNAKARTSWANSETLINRLITNAIQTGTATVLCAGIELGLFVKLTSTNYHITPAYILGKLYSNSLLVTLNSRKSALSMNTSTNQSDSYAMRSHGTRQRSYHPHDRTVDDWPGVKISQIATSDATIADDTDSHNKPLPLDFTSGKPTTNFV